MCLHICNENVISQSKLTFQRTLEGLPTLNGPTKCKIVSLDSKPFSHRFTNSIEYTQKVRTKLNKAAALITFSMILTKKTT